MTTERRLDALTSELTAKERALLCLRAWCKGERVDERVIRYCPPQDKAEMDRICSAVEQDNSQANGYLGMLLEWTANLESEIEWLRVLTIYQEHLAAVEKLARSAVPAMPRPWKSERKVPMGCGKLTRAADDSVPLTWKQFREQGLKGVQNNLQHRWQDMRAYEVAFDELAVEFGEPVMHTEVAENLNGFRESLLRLTDEVERLTGKLELPEPSEEKMDISRSHFDWEAIRPAGREKHARERMQEAQRQELEEFEREQAEQIRSRS